MGNPIIAVGSSVGIRKEIVPGTPLVVDTWLDLISEELDYEPVLLDAPTPIGTRQNDADFMIVTHHDGKGSFTYRPRHADIGKMLELILGVLNGGMYSPIFTNTAIPSFSCAVGKGGQNTIKLGGCKVNTAEFVSEANKPLVVCINLLAMNGLRDAVLVTPVYTTVKATKPYLHGNMTMDATGHAFLGGAAGPACRKLTITINNNLDGDAFTNSTTRVLIPEGLFTVTGAMEIAYNATTKAFWTDMVAASKVKWSVTWSDGTNNFEVNLVTKITGKLPAISGPEVSWLELGFVGVADATDSDVITASVSD
jgi:hypothetical protein